MAIIDTFKIISVTKSQVNFSYSYKSEAFDDGPSYDEEFREESGFSWNFSTVGGTSSSSPCNYTMGGAGNDTYALKATLTYNYSIGKYIYSSDPSSSKIAYFGYKLSNAEREQEFTTYKITYSRSSSNDIEDTEGNIIYYAYIKRTYETEKKYNGTNLSTSTSTTLNFYPHPATFTFANCVSGKTWKIDDGLDSLITNINNFQKQAQQWKSWKGQFSAAACPDFSDSSNYITAAQMNAVYTYVNKGTPWSPGDQISAAMFNDLATAINN